MKKLQIKDIPAVQSPLRFYISVPISGRPMDEGRDQIKEMQHYLSCLGHTGISPLGLYAGEDPTYADYIGMDITVMLKQDGVVFCRGSEKSHGCQMELAVARMENIRRRDRFGEDGVPPLLEIYFEDGKPFSLWEDHGEG